MSTDWDSIKNDPNIHFDLAKVDMNFVTGVFARIPEAEIDAIHAKLDTAIKIADKKIAVMETIKTIGSIALEIYKTLT